MTAPDTESKHPVSTAGGRRSGFSAAAPTLKGFDGLAVLVQQSLKQSPHSGALFAFRGRRGDLIKLLWYDGQGLCLFSKRMDRGRFVWPVTATEAVHLTPAQLSMLLEGIDWRRPERTWQPSLAG